MDIKEAEPIKEFKQSVDIEDFAFLTCLKKSYGVLNQFGAFKDCIECKDVNEKFNIEEIFSNNVLEDNDIITSLMVINPKLSIDNKEEKFFMSFEDYLLNYNDAIFNNHKIKQISIDKINGVSSFYKLYDLQNENSKFINAAVYVEYNKGKIVNLKIALGSDKIKTFRVYEIENLAIGKSLNYLYEDKTVRILKNRIKLSANKLEDFKIDEELSIKAYKEAVKRIIDRLNLSN